MSNKPSARDGRAVGLVSRLFDSGFCLTLEGGDIVVSPGSKLTPQLRAEIAANKSSIVRLLAHDACVRCGGDWWVLAAVAVDGSRVCAACVLRRRKQVGRAQSMRGGAA